MHNKNMSCTKRSVFSQMSVLFSEMCIITTCIRQEKIYYGKRKICVLPRNNQTEANQRKVICLSNTKTCNQRPGETQKLHDSIHVLTFVLNGPIIIITTLMHASPRSNRGYIYNVFGVSHLLVFEMASAITIVTLFLVVQVRALSLRKYPV